jgi:serine/threonine-protein kinase RsbW
MTSEADSLAPMRAWLREALSGHGLQGAAIAQLVVAVGELCSNAINHAYDGRPGQQIHVSVASEPGRVVVEVEDFGRPFDPERYTAPDLDQAAERGVGLYLVRALTDDASFDVARERGTRWTLVRNTA